MEKKKKIKFWLLPFISMKRHSNHLHLQTMAVFIFQIVSRQNASDKETVLS